MAVKCREKNKAEGTGNTWSQRDGRAWMRYLSNDLKEGVRVAGSESGRGRTFQVEEAAEAKGKLRLEGKKCPVEGPLRGRTGTMGAAHYPYVCDKTVQARSCRAPCCQLQDHWMPVTRALAIFTLINDPGGEDLEHGGQGLEAPIRTHGEGIQLWLGPAPQEPPLA